MGGKGEKIYLCKFRPRKALIFTQEIVKRNGFLVENSTFAPQSIQTCFWYKSHVVNVWMQQRGRKWP